MASCARSNWLVSAWMNCSTGNPDSRSFTTSLLCRIAPAYVLAADRKRFSTANWEGRRGTLFPPLYGGAPLQAANQNKHRPHGSARLQRPSAALPPRVPATHLRTDASCLILPALPELERPPHRCAHLVLPRPEQEVARLPRVSTAPERQELGPSPETLLEQSRRGQPPQGSR